MDLILFFSDRFSPPVDKCANWMTTEYTFQQINRIKVSQNCQLVAIYATQISIKCTCLIDGYDLDPRIYLQQVDI